MATWGNDRFGYGPANQLAAMAQQAGLSNYLGQQNIGSLINVAGAIMPKTFLQELRDEVSEWHGSLR